MTHQRAETRAAVHERRVLEFLRDGFEEPHQQPDRERDRERRIDQDQRPQPVLEAELGDDARERQEEQRRWDEVGEEDRDAEAAPDPSRETGERVPGRHGDDERDQRHDQTDEARVPVSSWLQS